MIKQLIHGSGRVWRAAGLAVSGAAVVLTIGAFGAGPALAGGGGNGWGGGGGGGNWGQQGPLIPVFVVQPTTTVVNTAVSTVVVKVEHAGGQLDWNYDGPVFLKYAVNQLGAPEPTGDVTRAWHGVARFSDLTFGAVGFGFELSAVIPQQPEGPWFPGSSSGSGWGWNWGWQPSFGGFSPPSAPFDIVDQILQCQSYGTCQTNPVSSDGTSGYATASGGQLIATGGGFPDLSCGTVGGVLTFSSTEGQTITTTLPGYLAGHRPLWSYNICWGASEPFTTKWGGQSQFNTANNEYEGLLPSCRPWRPAPCVQSRSRTWPWGAVTITILAPAGDPRPMWG